MAKRMAVEPRAEVSSSWNEANPTRIRGYCGPIYHCPAAKYRLLSFPNLMQLQLFARRHVNLSQTAHGGDHGLGRRKVERPVSSRRPMHLTLHSKRARGPWSLRRHEQLVREALRTCARRSGVRIYDFANVGSHLHLLVRAKRRDALQAFLRAFAGIIARAVTGARRGHPVPGGRFWTNTAWSRVVAWGRDYWGVRNYIFRNQMEATAGPGVRRAMEHGPAP
jgi:REP element-mobilizing transposase RayT